MIEAGMEVIEVDNKTFRKEVLPVNERLADKYGCELYDRYRQPEGKLQSILFQPYRRIACKENS